MNNTEATEKIMSIIADYMEQSKPPQMDHSEIAKILLGCLYLIYQDAPTDEKYMINETISPMTYLQKIQEIKGSER